MKSGDRNGPQYLIQSNKSLAPGNRAIAGSKGGLMKGQKKVPVPDDWLAAEIGKQGLVEKLKRLETTKASNETLLAFLGESNSPMKRYHKRISDCGTWLVLRHFHQVDESRVIKANFCRKNLLCATCAMRRSALQVRAFQKKFRFVMDQDSDLVPVLVTLTVKNGSDLGERFQLIDGGLSRLIKKRRNAIDNGRENTVLRHVLGGSGSYEFKRGSGSRLWHPHVHQIWLLRKGEFAFTMLQDKKRMVWVPVEFKNALSDEWKAMTDGSHQVDVRRIEVGNQKDQFGAICEAFKYALKLDDMTEEDKVHAAEVLQGRRLQRSFGNLHGVDINEDLVDDIEQVLALQPYVDLVYNYNKTGYVLVEKTDYGLLEIGQKTQKHPKKRQEGQKAAGFTQKQVDAWVDDFLSIQLEGVPF